MSVLVTWNSNWADEMDISGFALLSQDDVDVLKMKLSKKDKPFEIYIGTNESIDYSSGEDLLSELEFQTLTVKETDTIEKLFGDHFGHTDFLYAIDFDDEEDDEDEEEWDGSLDSEDEW